MTDPVRSGAELQRALTEFVRRWSGYSGSERAEAQTFLNELFAAYGSDRQSVGARFEDFRSSAGFMDLHWPGVMIVEMKAPGVALEKAADQRDRYWRESSDPATDTPAARWVVLCNFQEFEIWEPGRFPNRPRSRFTLAELPEHYDALLFLQNESLEPVFSEHRRELTEDAARHVAELYRSMLDRSAAPVDEIQRFTMQLVWCLFAEDLGMLEGYPLQATVEALLKEGDPDSAKEIGYLFQLLNQKGDHNRKGRFAGTRYVNGDLFARPAAVYLDRSELLHLKQAAEFNWREVNPTIFGSLLEGVLGDDRRSEIGAHYTHEADIMKIVAPTIVRPWRERIETTGSVTEAVTLLDELCDFRVLDPACGCGNFLYVAYRELRGLEFDLKQRIDRLAAETGAPRPTGTLPFYPLSNLFGIDIERVAVMIARVTLWMGHRQMIERYGEAEPVLPLVDLSRITPADALQTDWPEVDAIIGNPPFLGSQLVRQSLGDDYVDWLSRTFGVGVRDLCVYWFRIAQDRLKPGQRAGLVGTNSISQNRGRVASLDYVVANGGVITDAVSSQKWPGDAKVHVSIVNWVKDPEPVPTLFELDGASVEGISPSLRPHSGEEWPPATLGANRGQCFQGPIPVGAGFVISDDVASSLLGDGTRAYREVVRPYLTSDDIAESPRQSPSRWIIDFGSMPLEDATRYPRALDIVRRDVKPERDTNRDPGFKTKWWQFGRPRGEMRLALAGRERYAAVGRHGKRMFIAWVEAWALASDATNVFAFDDDYSMGILLSRAHDSWAWAQSSTLETRLRYTPTTVFDTFPWPDPVTPEQRETIAAASRALYDRRSELCIEHSMGLTKLYNLMDEGGFADLAALHRRLDEAVAAAYGWPKSVAQDPEQIVSRLTALNREIVEGGRTYDPFADSASPEDEG
ncbi:DNA methyltransferase [Microbacterium schleiferi]|uniref:DNA methyltransferase n=1 Tax=Microbacterium schleiferi TaxID=69362 RepID=UPI00311FC667